MSSIGYKAISLFVKPGMIVSDEEYRRASLIKKIIVLIRRIPLVISIVVLLFTFSAYDTLWMLLYAFAWLTAVTGTVLLIKGKWYGLMFFAGTALFIFLGRHFTDISDHVDFDQLLPL